VTFYEKGLFSYVYINKSDKIPTLSGDAAGAKMGNFT